MRLHQQMGDKASFICKKCEAKHFQGQDVVRSFVCTTCHQTKEKCKGIFFNAEKYDSQNEQVKYALADGHRIQKFSEKEWICRACDNGLRQHKGKYRGKFQPCLRCKSGMCDEKMSSCDKSTIPHPPKLVRTFADVVKVGKAWNQQQVAPPDPFLPDSRSEHFWTTVLGHFAAMRSFDELQKYIIMDHGDVFSHLPELPAFQGNQHQPNDQIDMIAMQDLPGDQPFAHPFPISTRADGNCFANSLSHIVYGNENHSDEMRVRLVVDAVINKKQYLDSVTLQNGIDTFVPSDNFVDAYLMYSLPASVPTPENGVEEDWRREVLYEQCTFDVRRSGVWCNIWQFHQAANVLQCKVNCIYPDLRAQERRIFNRSFVPVHTKDNLGGSEMVHIMFCRSSVTTQKVNHFVPVVEQEYEVHIPQLPVPAFKRAAAHHQQPIVIDIDCTPEKQKMSSSRKQEEQKPFRAQRGLKRESMDSLDEIQICDPVAAGRNINVVREKETPSHRRKQATPFKVTKGLEEESMDSLDEIRLCDPVGAGRNINVVGEKETPSHRRKQATPQKAIHDEDGIGKTATPIFVRKKPSSRRKQEAPNKLYRNSETDMQSKKNVVRKRMFSETVCEKAINGEGDFLPFVQMTPTHKQKPNTPSKVIQDRFTHEGNPKRKTKSTAVCDTGTQTPAKQNGEKEKKRRKSKETIDAGTQTPGKQSGGHGKKRTKFKETFDAGTQTPAKANRLSGRIRKTKGGHCTCCHVTGKRMKFFDEANYDLSGKMKETIFAEKYRIIDVDGDELICGPCHTALKKGSKRRNWCYYKDHNSAARANFLSALSDMPEYPCTVCHRVMFQKGMALFDESAFNTTNQLVCECLLAKYRIKAHDGKEYICITCQKELSAKDPKMPYQAVANGLEIPEQPVFLKNLKTLERRCIGLHIPFMQIQSVRQRGKKITGPCVNVPANLEPICSILPRLPEEMKTVLVKLKRRLHYDSSYMYDYIRPQVVMRALLWLKAHNPLYKDVEINHNWFEELEESSEKYFDTVKDTDAADSDGSDCEEKELKKANEVNLPEIKVEQNLDLLDGTDEKGDTKNDDLDSNQSQDDFKEEQAAADEKAKISVQPSSTCVQLENLEEAIFSIAPGEHSKPKLILTDEEFELTCFPDFFPEGKGSFLCPERSKDIVLRRYVNQRLLNVNGKFAQNMEYVFSMQYAVELKQLDTCKNVYIRNHSARTGNLNASMLRDSSYMTQLVSNDEAYKFMNSVRGTPAYWKSKLHDTLGMFHALGKPTWFLTLSAAEHLWPEMIQAVGLAYGERYSLQDIKEMNSGRKSRLLRRNPVITVRVWKHRLESFFNLYVKNHKSAPLGKVADFVVKIEFQARGSPHAHILLWIEGAPQIDIDDDEMVCEFIDHYSIGRILKKWNDAPSDCTSDELAALVERVQVHKHNRMCRATKKHKCRHSFPKVPCFKTIVTRPDLRENLSTEELKANQSILSAVREEIENDPSKSLAEVCKKCSLSEEKYMDALRCSDSSRSVILQREPEDMFVNNYNPNILSLWKANMDVQFCVDTYQCINYLLNYVVKTEKGMSELMVRVKENYKDKSVREQMNEMTKVFTGKREVSIQEAAYRVLSLPLYYKSKKVVFISPHLEEKRDRVPKSVMEISKMEDEEEDIYETSIHDRYEARPKKLESMCLADFATWYELATENGASGRENYIELNDGLGYMRKRKEKALMRSHFGKRGTEEYFQGQLKLFFPYRKESDLLGECESYAEQYAKVIDTIETNSERYNVFQDEIDDAIVEHGKNQQKEKGSDWDNENQNGEPSTMSLLAKKFRTEAKKEGKMSTAEYIKKVRTSNKKQKEIVMWCRNHVKKQIRQMKQGHSPEGFKIVLSGAGGTGKSHVIGLINHDMIDLFGRTNTVDPNDLFQEGRNPEKPTALLTAMTGTAAFNIGGSTLHSVLLMYQNILPKEKACILQSQLHQLELLTVDEFSMMGSQMLSLMNRRCCFIKQNTKEAEVQQQDLRNFGNINILLVGDPYQLPAVRQTPIYRPPPIKKLEDFQEPIWREFKLHELTQIMRQKDHQFADLLSRVRVEAPSPNSNDDLVLQSRELTVTFDDPEYPRNVLHVFAQNDAANFHNELMLTLIKDRSLYTCEANDSVDSAYGRQPMFPEKASETGNLQKCFKVKVGARVVLTNNLDVSDGMTNGAYGTVTCVVLNKDPGREQVRTILVQFDSPVVGKAAIARSRWKKQFPHSVPIERTEMQFPLRRGKMLHTASRQQFPLFLAWGVTIHKVQGLTLPEIVVDMDPKKGRFQKGQAYVAFSRVTSEKGLHICNYCLAQIRVEKDIHEEMEVMRKQPVESLPETKLPELDADIKIAHMNINGLMFKNLDKSEDLKLDSVVGCVDIFCLSETHLSSGQDLRGDFWDEFQVHRQDRSHTGGGVLIAAKRTLVSKTIALPDTFLEIIGTSFTRKEENTVNVFCVYISPMTNKSLAADELERLLEPFQSDFCVVTGDINEDLLSSSEKSKVLSALNSLGFSQHISEPTTIYGSLLDHMYVNCNCGVHSEVHEAYFSDHDVICAGLQFENSSR